MKRNKSGKSMERHPSTSRPIDIKWSDDWWASRSPEQQARRCTARKSDGSNVRCKNPALTMQTVCRYHGGATKNAQAAARRRLGEAQDYLARLLLGIAESAESEAVKLQAIKHGLSLGGTTEKTSVEVAVEMQPWQRILTGVSHAETREEAARRRGDTRTLEAIGANADEFVVDAEVIDDEDDRDDDEEPAERTTRRWKPADASTDEQDTDPSAYVATAPPVTGMAAIEAAADANRAAGVWSKKKRRR